MMAIIFLLSLCCATVVGCDHDDVGIHIGFGDLDGLEVSYNDMHSVNGNAD